ncbi:NAD(P)-binding protein [Astrocystis sublimbata]|nr:NAD(P)-binding protein [Astrocystis sublimbata]KAI0191079.1 NAD(P)-binding protein [Astrocystis sublimbata]
MPSFVITGVSRSLGFEFLRQYSAKPENAVIGIVRDKASTDKKVSEELGDRSNIHIIEADITKYDDLKRAADVAGKINGGRLNYLIANAGYVSQFDAYDGIGTLGQYPQELEADLLKCFTTNVVANVHLINLFLPQILKGDVKKVIALSSGLADLDPINKFDLEIGPNYTISKAGLNAAIAKFSAQYKKDGVLFMAIGPGLIEVGQYSTATPEQLQRMGGMLQKFLQYEPSFKGPVTPEVGIHKVISVIERATIEDGFGGSFVSQNGNKQRL